MIDLSIPTVDLADQYIDPVEIAKKNDRYIKGRLYMGCVTDHQFALALNEQYPNRKWNHPDAGRRSKVFSKHRDIPELAQIMSRRTAIRMYRD